MAKLDCRELRECDLLAYDELIQNQGTVFAHRNWLRLLGGETTILGLFDGGDRLIGAFPISIGKRFGLRVVLRSPFTPFCGPYFSSELNHSKSVIESRRYFLSKICTYLAQIRPSICCLSLDPTIQDCLPFRWSGYKVISAYTYRIDLLKSEKEIQANFSSTRRRVIRSAARDELRIEPLESYSLIESLAQNTFDRQEKRLPVNILRRILYEFATPENSFAFAAFRESKAIAAVFCVFDKTTAYYLIGGYDSADAHPGAGAACMQEAILKSKSLGLKTFDFEGSVIPAIERYFRGFGGELTPYFTANRAWLPIEMLLKLRKRELF